MRKLLFIVFIFCSLIYGNELNYLNHIETAKEKATQENKDILIMLTQEGCPTCEYMEDVAFSDTVLLSYLNANFVLVKLDINNDRIPPYLKAYGTPTFYILNQQGEKIGRQIVGGGTAEAFLKLLQTYKTKN